MINNDLIYKKYKLIREHHEFSSPLLVCPDIKQFNPTIMYIGKETNGWGDGTQSLDEIELLYKNYYYNLQSRKLFWKFIKEIYQIQNNIHEQIIWCNALIAGKIGEIGTPNNSNLLEEISVENLVNIYNNFNIEKIIIVSGPSNPYYRIVQEFLKRINIDNDYYPTLNNPIVYNEKIIWTYHPNYQNQQGFFKENIKQLKKIVI